MMSVSLSSPSRALTLPPASPLAPSTSCGLLRASSATLSTSLSSRAALSCGRKLYSLGRTDLVGLTPNAAMRTTTTTASVVSPVDLNARRPEVETAIDEAMANCITETYLNDRIPSLGPKIRGKVFRFGINFVGHIFWDPLPNGCVYLVVQELQRAPPFSLPNFSRRLSFSFFAYFVICAFGINLRVHRLLWQVRDIYEAGDYMVLVTTDRQSAFDRVLASVPFKGQVKFVTLKP